MQPKANSLATNLLKKDIYINDKSAWISKLLQQWCNKWKK